MNATSSSHNNSKGCFKDDIIYIHLSYQQFLSLWFQKDGFRQFDLFWSHCWKGTWKTYHIVWEPSVILLLNWAWWTYSFSPSEFSSLVWIASSFFNIFYMIGSLLGSIIYISSLDITGFMKRMFFRKLIIWTISLNLKKLFCLKNLFLFQILNSFQTHKIKILFKSTHFIHLISLAGVRVSYKYSFNIIEITLLNIIIFVSKHVLFTISAWKSFERLTHCIFHLKEGQICIL